MAKVPIEEQRPGQRRADYLIEHHHHFDSATLSLLRELVAESGNSAKTLTRIERAMGALQKQGTEIMASIENLEAEVAAGTTVQESAITLLGNLTTLIQAAGTDPVKLAAVVTQLTTNRAALAAAIVANTPAAGEPPVEPPAGRNR